ncbi:MAG: hypothetical protein HS116_17895 [Planctomycetes bacterium]|nr:hypothetical protein [Planctomycetota bacterium]
MPKERIKVSIEQAELLGDLRTAAKEAERLATRAEKALLKLEAAGGSIKNAAALDRIGKYRAQADGIRERLEETRRIEQAVDKSLPGRLVRLLNTHNPHGRLRQVLSGNVNGGTVNDAGGGLTHLGAVLTRSGNARIAQLGARLASGGAALSAAAVRAGPGIAITGILARHAANMIEERDRQHERRVEIEGAGASARLRRSIDLRFSSDTGALDFQRQQRQILARQEDLDREASTSVFGFTSQAHLERTAKGRERRADLADWIRRHTSTFGKDSGGRFQSARFMNHPDVEYQMSLGAMLEKNTSWDTIREWVKQETVDRLTGAREEKRRELAIKMADKAKEDADAQLELEAALYWKDTTNQIMEQERTWHQRVVNEFMIQRNLN